MLLVVALGCRQHRCRYLAVYMVTLVAYMYVAYIGCDLHRLYTCALRHRSQRFLRAGGYVA